MNTAAIRIVAMKSAEQMFNYMDSQVKPSKRGETHHNVRKITEFGDGVILLALYQGLNDISLARLEIDGKKIDDKLYEFVSYDDISKTVVMKASKEIANLVRPGQEDKVEVIHDFKFLIKRIHDFLEKYGDRLEYPCKGSMSRDSIRIPETSNPSRLQAEAIEMCLTEPSSYVWGAPGTGKTQYVLANSIINDIRNGKKVAVFAPTNTSVEQVLLGLIKEIKHNPEFAKTVDLDKDVLRVGVPSMQFLSNFPSMCEKKSVKRNQKVLRHTIKALRETADEMRIDALERDFKSFMDLKEDYQKASKDERIRIEDSFEALIEKAKAIPVLKGAMSNVSILDMWGSVDDLIKAAYRRPRPRRYMDEYAQFSIQDMEELIANQQAQLDSVTNPKTLYWKKKYSKKQEPEMSYQEAKEKSKAGATLSTAKLIVCTPHQFVHRMVPKGVDGTEKHVLDVGHIYVDEVGYSNLMHIISLFTNRCPITFLGDHMQLDPVFTMDREFAINQIRTRGEYCHAFLWGTSAIHLEELFFKPDLSVIQRSFIEDLDPPYEHMKLTVLKESYRFGQNLARILDEKVYGNVGLSGISQNGSLLISCISAPGTDVNYSNESEAEAIGQFVRSLSADDGTVAVLAPYNNQVFAINQKLKGTGTTVMTIHKSQGREWDTVIISVTNNDPDSRSFMNTTSIRNLKLINTAVSRAKRHLVIVCDFDKWAGRKDQLISSLVDYADDNGELYEPVFEEAVSDFGYDEDDF